MEQALGSNKNVINIIMHLDIVCPWCYIQKRSLEAAIVRYKAAHPEMAFEIIYKPFILNPTNKGSPDKRSIYERRVGSDKISDFLTRIHAAGAPVGITFSLAGRFGPSLAAHTLSALVLQRLGPAAQARVLDRLFAGHFEFGHDISDEEWLVELGRGEGLETEDVRAALGSEQAAWLVKREAAAARAQYGVEAVPCVTVQGRYRVGGFQQVVVFEELFERVRGDAGRTSPREG